MRFEGKLKSWNQDKGYGFIAPLSGAADVFVHASAFGKGNAIPAIGERISYEISVGRNGKPQACNISWANQIITPKLNRPKRTSRKKSSFLGDIIFYAVLAALVYFAFPYAKSAFQRMQLATEGAATQQQPLYQSKATQNRYSCDGRQHCSQMSSCEEATWFINNCPNTMMDGDGDGVPCESQWCSSF